MFFSSAHCTDLPGPAKIQVMHMSDIMENSSQPPLVLGLLTALVACTLKLFVVRTLEWFL